MTNAIHRMEKNGVTSRGARGNGVSVKGGGKALHPNAKPKVNGKTVTPQ